MNTNNTIILSGAIIIAALIVTIMSFKESVPRFQISAGPEHSYVIDMHTGQVWGKFHLKGQGSDSKDFMNPKID